MADDRPQMRGRGILRPCRGGRSRLVLGRGWRRRHGRFRRLLSQRTGAWRRRRRRFCRIPGTAPTFERFCKAGRPADRYVIAGRARLQAPAAAGTHHRCGRARGNNDAAHGRPDEKGDRDQRSNQTQHSVPCSVGHRPSRTGSYKPGGRGHMRPSEPDAGQRPWGISRTPLLALMRSAAEKSGSEPNRSRYFRPTRDSQS